MLTVGERRDRLGGRRTGRDLCRHLARIPPRTPGDTIPAQKRDRF
jgi:hypothetical protein